MKRILLIIILLSSVANAQNNKSVEKSLFTIQTGTIGIWVNNETRLTDKIALRTEIGLYTEILGGSGFFMAPEITLEPRWYYNMQERTTKKRDVTNNSANFFTIKTSFRSNIFELSSFDDGLDRAENSFAIIPKLGIKRNLGKHFNYEVGLGVGYIHFINQKYFRTFDNNGIVIDLHVRIGYNF
ncbi:MAG: hypothetical protein ACPGUU_06645 [Flavobacteriaceae bacterium]